MNELHIDLSGLPADLGRTTGGLANFNTRHGTNDYHGAVFDFYKNAALDGNNWFKLRTKKTTRKLPKRFGWPQLTCTPGSAQN